MQVSTELKTILDSLSKAIRPEIQEIENGPELSKNHYQSYISLISMLCNGEKSGASPAGKNPKFWALVLIQAGANKAGVISAVELL
jgi:hypothetical protein